MIFEGYTLVTGKAASSAGNKRGGVGWQEDNIVAGALAGDVQERGHSKPFMEVSSVHGSVLDISVQ